MEREALEKALQGMCAARGKVWAESVPTDILQLVLVGKWRDGALRIFASESLLQKDEIGESATGG